MPNKSLGQNFLNNNNILSGIVKCGDISNKDIILEIGPGTGNLTEKILEKKPKHLVVVEKDEKLSTYLRDKFGDRIEIINNDILDCYNEIKFDRPMKVFGNLPYNISTKILSSFIKIQNLRNNFKKFVLIFQKEVADRITANDNSKNYGRLSILTSWKMNAIKIFDINPKFFFPRPKVWSTLITLEPKQKYENIISAKNLEYITNIFFTQRRKMIKKPMKQIFSNYEKIAKELEIDLNLRPQNLSDKNYFEICKIYESLI